MQTQLSTKRISTSIAMLMTCAFGASQANAFLVDKTEQRTIMIGRSGEAMQAVKVQQIQTPPQTVQTRYIEPTPTYTHTQANTQVYQRNPYQARNQYNTSYNTAYRQGGYSSYSNVPMTMSLNSRAAAIYDLQTGQLLYQKNINSKRSIASISKVMTAMVLTDANLPLGEEIVLIASDFVGAKKAGSNLKVGDRMSRSELMLLMLMKSENPAAKALARTYPGGYDAFIWAMNQKAQSLGMYQTSFSDSSGLDPRNVSSASDLISMMRVLNAYPQYQIVRNFSTATSYDFGINNYNSGFRVYKAANTSRVVRAGNYPVGVSKTGFIREAGYCVVMETHINNKPAIVVLLGAPSTDSRWDDADNVLTQLAYRY